MPIRPLALLRGACAALSALLIISCGGGGNVPGGVTLRSLPSAYTSRKAVAYSPFRSSNRDTETVTAAMVKEDLDLLVAGNFKLIRLFDSSDAVAKLVMQVITANSMDIKVQLGIYIASGNDTFNQAEIARGIALAGTYPAIVVAVSVGNETMVSWTSNAVSTTQMATYINQVRNGVTQPVTTDDNWAFFSSAPVSILGAIDFVALHTYPLADSISDPTSWDWKQASVDTGSRATAMMDAAIAKAKKDYTTARTYLDSIGFTSLPIVIGETGWKAIASNGETYRAHPVNQKMYFDRLTTWLAASGAPKAIFYFEAFDEPWKGGDDDWGLFDVSRKARYAVQDLYASSLWESGTYTSADAVYYIATTTNSPVTANRYTLYSETAVSGEAFPYETLTWNAWQNGTTASAVDVTTTFSEGAKSKLVTPIPLTWGWGMTMMFPTSSDDLSAFATSGYLHFSIKTTYTGKLMVGFLTGTAASMSLYDVYIPIASGSYGYVNDGAWHDVAIPISDITPYGAMAYGMTDSSLSKLDMTIVTNPFVIADTYAITGKSTGAGITTPIYLDNIYWSK